MRTCKFLSPGLAVAGDANEREDGHDYRVGPPAYHDLHRHGQLETLVEVDGVGNGVPSLRRDHRQRKDG